MDNRFEEIYIKQQELNDLYKTLTKESNVLSLESEINALSEETKSLNTVIEKLKKDNLSLQKAKTELYLKLKDQTINEKLNLIHKSQKKMAIYFEDNKKQGLKTLKTTEADVKRKIDNMYALINKNIIFEKDQLIKRLNDLQIEIVKEMHEQKDYLLKSKSRNMGKLEGAYKKIKQAEVTDATQAKIEKMDSLELKMGLNTLNYIGILLILLSLVTFGRYAYISYFSDLIKTGALFMGSVFLIGLGEFSKRSNYDKISLGFFGGGIAALYISSFVATFYLEVFTLTTGLVISASITLLSIFLTFYNNSLIIGSLALIGGYLPLYSYFMNYGFNAYNIWGIIVYTLIFYVIILSLAIRQKWQLLNVLSFVFCVPWVLILTDHVYNLGQGLLLSVPVFMMYLLSVFSYKLLYKIPLTLMDAMVLVLNNILNMVLVIYLLTEYTSLTNFGFLALVYATLYGLLYYLISRLMPYEKLTKAIMFIFTAASIFIFFPLQFLENEGLYESMWAIFSVAIMYQALKIESKILKVTAYVFTLSAMTSLLVHLYTWQNNLITTVIMVASLAMILYLNTYKFKHKIETMDYTVFKNLATLYAAVLIYLTVENVMTFGFGFKYAEPIYIVVTHLLIGNAFGFILIKLNQVDVKIVASLVILATLIYTLYTNMTQIEMVHKNFALTLLILQNSLLILSIREVTLYLANKVLTFVALIPLVMTIYIALSITSLMISQFNLANEDVILSAIYLSIALASVYYGIKFLNPVSRRFGLGLTFITLGKYFIVDLRSLEILWKIGAYFMFGLLVICISIIYQKFSKAP